MQKGGSNSTNKKTQAQKRKHDSDDTETGKSKKQKSTHPPATSQNKTATNEKSKSRKPEKKPALTAEERKQAKKQSRKLRQLQDRKEKEARREKLYSALAQTALPADKYQLIQPSKALGQKETAKQHIKRTLLKQKVGIAVPEENDLRGTHKVIREKVLRDWQNEWTTEAEADLYGQRDAAEKAATTSDGSSSQPASAVDNITASAAMPIPMDLQKMNTTAKAATESKAAATAASNSGAGSMFIPLSAMSASFMMNEFGGSGKNKSNDSTKLSNKERYGHKEEETSEEEEEAADESEGESESASDNTEENEDVESDVEDEAPINEESVVVQQSTTDDNESSSDVGDSASSYQEQMFGENADSITLVKRLLDEYEAKQKRLHQQQALSPEKTSHKFFVKVNRKPEIQAQREALPVFAEEHTIMEAISFHPVVIVCGETGSGKTTQIPQFLYEAGYGNPQSENPGKIGVTQPRRVAAVSVCKRVAEELNLPFGKQVAYQIRYESNVSDKTQVKFMTDGILLKEIQSDFLLTDYSAIILDEAHERTLNTDILIGLLSRIVALRNSMATQNQQHNGAKVRALKLIIMSATLRVEDFTQNPKLFPQLAAYMAEKKQQEQLVKQEQMNRKGTAKLSIEDLQDTLKANTDADNASVVSNSSASSSHSSVATLLGSGVAVEKKGAFGASVIPIPSPLIHIKARQFPVTIHFNKHTAFGDYVSECYHKVTKIHQKLPFGGILVFLTGRDEIELMCKRLRTYSRKLVAKERERERLEMEEKLLAKQKREEEKAANNESSSDEDSDSDGDSASSSSEEKAEKSANEADDSEAVDFDLESDDDAMSEDDDEEEAGADGALEDEGDWDGEPEDLFNEDDDSDSDSDSSSEDESADSKGRVKPMKSKRGGLHVLPLYSMLPPERQMKVFQPPPEGTRLCVVATNVAETSITIPGIRYIVDCGRVKEKRFEKMTGVTTFEVGWASKAAADQRAGRAGRTGPGHCYRVYSSSVYEQFFKQFSDPEILKTPIDSIALQMKAMGINKLQGFPFPTPPERESIKQAITTLKNIGALDTTSERITPLGESLNVFPVAPRYAKMIVLGKQGGCLPYVLSIVSAMTVEQLFMHQQHISGGGAVIDEADEDAVDDADGSKKKSSETEQEETRQRAIEVKKLWAHEDSDMLAVLRAVGAYEYAGAKDWFCAEHFLHTKNMKEVHSLKQQLVRIVNKVDPTASIGSLDPSMPLLPPTPLQELMLRQIVASGLCDQVARLATMDEWNAMELPGNGRIDKRCPPYVTLTLGSRTPVFFHPTSYLFGRQQPPEFVVFQHLVSTPKRIYMRGVTAVHGAWLADIGRNMCVFSKPLDVPQPKYNADRDCITCYVNVTFGPLAWNMPIHETRFPAEYKFTEYQFMAKYFVEGKLFPALQTFVDSLTTSTGAITEKLLKSKKAKKLVDTFVKHKLDSKAAMIAQWRRDPSCLLREYLEWVPASAAPVVKQRWPPIDSTATKSKSK